MTAFQRDSKSLVAYSSVVHIRFLFFIFFIIRNISKNCTLLIIISHGYISRISFLIVGLFFHTSYTRLIYFIKGLFISNFFIFLLFSITLLLNTGLPPRVAFLSEFLGIIGRISTFKYSFFFLFLYFFLSFYYSIYFLVNFSIGDSVLFLGLSHIFFTIPFIYIIFNLNFIYTLVYLDRFLSKEYIFLFSIGFLIKFPVYFLHF